MLLPQVAVADRTALILDIFSQRARTREGKLQVGRLLNCTQSSNRLLLL